MEKLIWTDEDKFFITTFNKRLYDDYAYKFLQTYAETKQTIKMICYVEEDYQYPNYAGITYVNILKEMPELVAFKERHKDKVWNDRCIVSSRRCVPTPVGAMPSDQSPIACCRWS